MRAKKTSRTDIISGGGEMGDIIRGFAWESTDLGAMESWPPALVTAIRITLASPVPAYLSWGSGRFQFYNDHFRSILGGRHPLHTSSAAESFPEIAPLLGRVMEGESFTIKHFLLAHDRHGYVEECYFDFSFGPAPGDDGAPAGVLVTARDTTFEVIGERRFQSLSELSNKAAAATTIDDAVEAITSTIEANDFDFASATLYISTGPNQLTLRGLVRLEPDERVPQIIDFSESDSDNVLVRTFHDRGTVLFDTEPYNQGRDFIAGHWKEPVREGYIMAITRPGAEQAEGVLIIGLNPRRRMNDDYREFLLLFTGQAARALHAGEQGLVLQRKTESEAWLRQLIAGSPVAIFTCDEEGNIPLYNRAAVDLFGGEPVLGKNKWYPQGELLDLNGEVIPMQETPMYMVVRLKKMIPGRELLVRRPDGMIRRVLPNPQPLYDSQGRVTGGLNVVIDVTQQHKSQQLLAENQERLRMAMNATQMGTWDYEPRSGRLYWSDECRLIYDVPAHVEIDFSFFEEHLFAEDSTRVMDAINRALAGENNGLFDIRYRIVRYSDHKKRWIRSQGKVYMDDARKPVLFIGTVFDITKDQKKEQELIDSLTLFKHMADDVPVMIWMTDERGMCTYLNQTWTDYTGQTLKDGLGYGWLSAVHQEDAELSRKLFMEAGEKKEPFSFAYRLKGRDGKYRWFIDSGRPRFNEDGDFEGYLGSVVDVNEQKLAEESSAMLAAIVQTTDDAIISKTLDGLVTSWNRGAEKLFGYTQDEMLGQSITRLFPSDRMLEEPAIMARIMRGEKVEPFETQRVRKDGAILNMSLTISPLFDRSGNIIGASKIARDITAQVAARQRLEDAEARLRLAAEGTGLATWDLDLVNSEIIYSPRLNEIFGYPPNTHVSHATLRSHVHPDDLGTVQVAFAEALVDGNYDYEARIIRVDQEIIWIRTQGKIIFDEQHKPLRMLGTMQDITGQKNYERHLEESENRLNIAIEAAELGTWELKLKTKELTVSPRYLEIFGYGVNEHPTHAEMLARVVPEDIPVRNAAFAEALKTGMLNVQSRTIHKDGSIRTVRARGKVFYDDKGEPDRMLGTLLDTTEQQNALHRLEESEERFRTIANTAPVMIWMSGNDRFSDFFNTSWLKFTGRTIEQEMGDGWLENVHPDDMQQCRDIYDRAYNEKVPFHAEYRLRRWDGQYRWVSDNAVPRYDDNGAFIGFISACMDVDDEKLFNKRLQESELYFKTITNVSPVALWMTNRDGVNTFVNDTWLKWTGVDEDQLQQNGWIDSLIEADKNYTLRLFKRKSANLEKFSTEFRFRLKDGSIRWGLSEGYPYYDNQGKFAGYAGSVTDITDRKMDEFRKNEFLAVASHELKTPLTSIKAYAQLLGNTYKGTSDIFLRNALTKVDNQVNRMTKLVADFLNLSKIESDKFQLEIEPFRMDEMITEVISDVQLVSPTHRIMTTGLTEVMIEADREKIAQVLTNFLTNAIKYSPGKKQVTVKLEATEQEVIVSVADEGIGIAADEHQKIFQRFYRAGANNIQFSGFGIGLYISAEIIRRHNGDIGVRSGTGSGSEFYFSVPMHLLKRTS